MGAWIEIIIFGSCNTENDVAPLVGAWIEIYFDIIHPPNYNVAPLVGAWIEILIRLHNSSKPFTSLLSWERGLKYRH